MSTYSRMLGRELPCNLMDLLSIRPLPLPASVHERLRQEASSGHDYPDVLYRLGLSHLGRQELGLARQRLQESVAAGPKFLKARLALAVVCDLLAEHASAAREIEAVLAEPESADTGADRYHLLCAAAFSFERLGEWEVAGERYAQALESDPSDLFARYRLAAIDLSQIGRAHV
jgi:Tfp pilus assembly protein PilF